MENRALQSHWYVKRDLLCVKRDLLCVNKDLVCVKRDLVCVKRDLVCVKKDLVFTHGNGKTHSTNALQMQMCQNKPSKVAKETHYPYTGRQTRARRQSQSVVCLVL